MNIEQIEKNLKQLMANFSKEEFVFDLLLAYGIPKATVTLLKKGQHNLSRQQGRVILKRKLFFQDVNDADLHETIDSLQKDPTTMRHSPRFIIITDYGTLLAADTKTGEHLDIPIEEIAKHYDFFLPWAGIEKHRHTNENLADRKAAEKMAKLYDEIMAENNIMSEEKIHDLNVFLSRLLFCFFAEDTKIFEDKLFTNSIASHTQSDGSDFSTYLEILFDILNSKDRSDYPQYLQKFPYVNGGLFAKKHWLPKFTTRSRKIIIECGELNWSKINPDIFGSMMQAVVHPSERGSLGMHYTSVANIMKVIEPLFLSGLRDELEQYRGNTKKLQTLLSRITRIKFFDPACGSGNFLIIALKELRRLEMDIIKELGILAFPGINLSQFYGIEIDDFAHEIAKLSLYLAEHQMNLEFQQAFGKVNPTLPLKTGGNIVCANATRVSWEDVCPKDGHDVYIMGNPPYLGSSMQSVDQKNELRYLAKGFKNYKNLDYISCWLIKATKFILDTNSQFAFVSTNSICQGEQVALLWPHILQDSLEIGFAYQSFKWSNNAKKNAGVTVVIVGLRNCSKNAKLLFNNDQSQSVANINPYLASGKNIFIPRRSMTLSELPEMVYGNKSTDNGHLFLSKSERDSLLKDSPSACKYIKKLVGSIEFIRGAERWCLWINDVDVESAMKIPSIAQRLKSVSAWRLESKAECTKECAKTPHRFKQITYRGTDAILVPRVSSERRKYIPIGFLDSETVILDSAQAIYGAKPWVFGIVSSLMHTVWVRAVAGRLKTDLRYSSALCYNTFPILPLTSKQKEEIERHVFSVLEEREKHTEKTISQMYDPEKMPEGLFEAHQHLDLAVDRCYRSKPFAHDEERLEYLFRLYEQMIDEEDINNNERS